MDTHELVTRIRAKKELTGIASSVIEATLKEYCTKHRITTCASEKEKKVLIRDVRSELRRLTSRFRPVIKETSYEEYIKKHASTRERLSFYPLLIQRIKELKCNSILDLGAGLNPLMLASLTKTYYAYDIHQQDMEIVSSYLKEQGIAGYARAEDIRTIEHVPSADLVLLFKVLDILDKKGHKQAEQLLTKLDAPCLLISFATNTLSGKRMHVPKRGWIEKLLTRLGYTLESFSSSNEIFYLARKKSYVHPTVGIK